ncbi:MAG: TIM barrel protein [Pseudomonadota bacterium]
MLRFSANLSLLFPDARRLAARVLAARAAGYGAVEVQFPLAIAGLAEWRQALDAAALPLALINVDAGDLMSGGDGLAGVPGREADFAAALAQCAQQVRVLRPACVNVLAGRQPAGVDRGRCLAVLRDNLARAVDVLAPLGVQVTVEAINPWDMPRFLIDGFAAMQELVASVPGTAMQFDIYHMARLHRAGAGPTPADLMAAHGATFAHVQFADVPGRGAPGTGALDFPALFAALERSGYRGWCGAEYLPSVSGETCITAWRPPGC